MDANHQEENMYMVLDSGNTPLAYCTLQGPSSGPTLQIEVAGGKEDAVAGHEVLELISMGRAGKDYQCRVMRQRGEKFSLEKIMELDPSVRMNLRVPVRFETFLYPLTGHWRGRKRARSVDLSCGGVGFFSEPDLQVKERMEIVIPVTDEPLVLRCEVLRVKELNERTMYAAKFVDMCEDEEVMVRRAVFSVQLQNEEQRSDFGGNAE